MLSAYKNINFKPPQNVAKNAEKGLELRKKYGKGGLSTQEAGKLKIGSGVARATSLKNQQNISPETVKQMVGFFNRHKVYKKNHIKKPPYSASYISWLLWGGDDGERWANLTLKRMEKAEKANLSELAEKTIQTIIVKKTPGLTLEKAIEKLKDAGGTYYKVDEKPDSFYFRQKDPNLFEKNSYTSFEIPKRGVIIVSAKLKDEKMSELEFSRSAPLKLSEKSENDIIQVLRCGKFYHDGREIVIEESDLQSMVKNFSEKVRGIDLMIDFSHNSEGEAAGWIKELKLSDDKNELFATVDWTPAGQKALKDKAFRYISADFSFAYKDNETKKDFGPTLFGAGLTNRPVVKSMKPVVLSESNNFKSEVEMDEKMGHDKNYALEEEKKMQEEEPKSLEDMVAELKAQLELKDEELLKLKAEHDALRRENEERVRAMEEEKALSEKNKKFDAKLSEGLVVEAQRQAFIDDDMEKFISLQAEIKLSESGSTQEPKIEKIEDVEDHVIKLSEELASKENISMDKAISRVLLENPKLNDKYNAIV